MEETKIVDIKYGSDVTDVLRIKISENQSIDAIEESLKDFKESDTFKDGAWADDDLIAHLESDAIEFEFISSAPDVVISLNFL